MPTDFGRKGWNSAPGQWGKRLDLTMQSIKRVYPRLPKSMRYSPAYQEAFGRQGGRENPRLHGQMMNRLVAGNPKLVS